MRRILALPALALAVVLAPVLTGASAGGPAAQPLWCLRNNYTFVALKLACYCGDTTLAEPATGGTVFSPDDSAPVPVPEPTEKAIRFYRSGNVLWCIRTLLELSVPALILFTGFSARLRDWAERTGRRWLFALAIYLVAFLALRYVLEFPLNCYQGF